MAAVAAIFSFADFLPSTYKVAVRLSIATGVGKLHTYLVFTRRQRAA